MSSEGGRILRLFSSHNYLSILCNGKVKGSPEKSNKHTLLMTISANTEDPSLVYIYGIKSRLFISMNDKEGSVSGVCQKECATIFKEDYARSPDDSTAVSENYLMYECVRDGQGVGWYLGIRTNGMVRRGSHTSNQFINELASKTEEKNKEKVKSRRRKELMFLPDHNVIPSEICEAENYECEECGRTC
ncbi:uncharacterized protein LOC108744083 [Agrilus planipennis]|uniref:Uncharacterized protein LOC108744083 n=1 Tax=Agrilus planipennis TaxID=224129 RepID=A0A1W4XRY1_AGRPL|nr:uncharacterized protein LOC108744083 [Agrilus planipennis]